MLLLPSRFVQDYSEERQRERERERETGRDRETERETDIETERDRERSEMKMEIENRDSVKVTRAWVGQVLPLTYSGLRLWPVGH
jgi:hypothetical protein